MVTGRVDEVDQRIEINSAAMGDNVPGRGPHTSQRDPDAYVEKRLTRRQEDVAVSSNPWKWYGGTPEGRWEAKAAHTGTQDKGESRGRGMDQMLLIPERFERQDSHGWGAERWRDVAHV